MINFFVRPGGWPPRGARHGGRRGDATRRPHRGGGGDGRGGGGRALEVREQENAYWRQHFEAPQLKRLVPLCDGDLDKIFELSERVRSELFKGLTPEMVREHLQRCLDPKNRVVVVLRPQRPLWRRMLFPDPRTTEERR